MKKKEAGEQVTAKQGLLLLFAAVLVIIVCKIVFNVDTKTTLMLSGAIGGIFGASSGRILRANLPRESNRRQCPLFCSL